MSLALSDQNYNHGSSINVIPCWAAEKAMATHSSVLAWRIPGTGEPGGLQSMGSLRVDVTE